MEASEYIARIPAFVAQQQARCKAVGIETRDFPIGHVAIRCRTWTEYLAARDDFERVSVANAENVWNGRPISKLVLAEPVPVDGNRTASLIELIPPFHQRVYRMGLEHVGFVLGDRLEAFIEEHIDALTGRQFQSRSNMPGYVLFPDYTHVKFHRISLRDACEEEGQSFAGFNHAIWKPVDPDAGPYEHTGGPE